ncbi:MAG: hypothetical protein AAF869_10545, partial [Pseudomonadota bacterium]
MRVQSDWSLVGDGANGPGLGVCMMSLSLKRSLWRFVEDRRARSLDQLDRRIDALSDQRGRFAPGPVDASDVNYGQLASAILDRTVGDTLARLGRALKRLLNIILVLAVGAFGALFVLKEAAPNWMGYFHPESGQPRWERPGSDWRQLADWVGQTSPAFRGQRFQQAQTADTVARFDQLALGAYLRHQDVDQIDYVNAYGYLNLAAAAGDVAARGLRDAFRPYVPDAARAKADALVVKVHEASGQAALQRLGFMYLGSSADVIARAAGVDLDLSQPNDFITQDKERAYRTFLLASECQSADSSSLAQALLDRNMIDPIKAGTTRDEVDTIIKAKREANSWTAFCEGAEEIVPPITSPALAAASPLATRAPAATGGIDDTFIARRLGRSAAAAPAGAGAAAFADALTQTVIFGDQEVERLAAARRPTSGADQDQQAEEDVRYNFPYEQGGRNRSANRNAVDAADWARYWLRLGEALQSIGRVDSSKFAYDQSVRLGRNYYAQAARVASERLRSLTLTCQYTEDSLKRIDIASPDYD